MCNCRRLFVLSQLIAAYCDHEVDKLFPFESKNQRKYLFNFKLSPPDCILQRFQRNSAELVETRPSNSEKGFALIGWFQNSLPRQHLYLDPLPPTPLALGNSKMLNPSLPLEFQTVLPPMPSEFCNHSTPHRNVSLLFLPTDLKSPL